MTPKPRVAGTTMSEMSVSVTEVEPAGQSTLLHDPSQGMDHADRRSPPASPRAPPGRRPATAERRRVAVLARTLETQVIPRLVLSRREGNQPAYIDSHGGSVPQDEDVTTLAALSMAGDLTGSLDYIAALRARDMPLEIVYLHLLAPVARRLGQLWEEDRCDFAAVTVGLCLLQQIVLESSPAFRPRSGRADVDRRILLAPVPGEQHSFGLLMVGEFFRRQGWEVCSGTGASSQELSAMVRRQWFAAVGFSLARDEKLDALAACIRDVRRASRNPQVGVLVGGRAFVERPELAALVGADATAADGQQAALKAETLLALLQRDA